MNDPSLNKVIFKNINNEYVELYGLNNFSISKNSTYAEQYLLGGICSSIQINSPQQIEISFDRSFINCDYLFNYTGDFAMNEVYIYNGDKYYYYIPNLYLNSYSIGFSVGELPRISTKFISYGNDLDEKQYIPTITETLSTAYDIPKLGSISITGINSDKLINDYNIFSFDYSVEINRQPYYGIGSKAANQINLIYPLKTSISINSKLKREDFSLYQDSIPTIKKDNFNFNINISGKNSTMIFPVCNAQLISSEIIGSSSNSLEIKKQFIGYYGL